MDILRQFDSLLKKVKDFPKTLENLKHKPKKESPVKLKINVIKIKPSPKIIPMSKFFTKLVDKQKNKAFELIQKSEISQIKKNMATETGRRYKNVFNYGKKSRTKRTLLRNPTSTENKLHSKSKTEESNVRRRSRSKTGRRRSRSAKDKTRNPKIINPIQINKSTSRTMKKRKPQLPIIIE